MDAFTITINCQWCQNYIINTYNDLDDVVSISMNKEKTWVDIDCKRCNKTTKRILSCILKTPLQFCSNCCRSEYFNDQRDPKQAKILNHINTPDFCYLIGLIATDGTISWPRCSKSATSYYCQISLQVRDRELLNKIHKIFGGKLYNKGKTMVVWKITHKKFIDYLRNNIGLTNQKSYNLDIEKWFSNLTKDNQLHFLRGTIDGDGCICNNTINNKVYWYVKIASGSDKFAKLLKNALPGAKVWKRPKTTDLVMNNTCKVQPYLNIISVNKQSALLSLKQLFCPDNSELFLERKQLKYKDFLKANE